MKQLAGERTRTEEDQGVVEVAGTVPRAQCDACSAAACAAASRSTVWRPCCRDGTEFAGARRVLVTGAPRSALGAVLA
eukprot:1595064-Rhodomonas_salina.1